MSTLVEPPKPQSGWELPPVKPLDEAAWQTWIAKGRAQDQRSSATRMKAVKWVTIAGLLAAAVLWSGLASHEVVIRFVVAAGALIVMVQAIHARYYVFAAIFGALMLLFNPVAPVLSFSGDWQRAVVIASAVPFVMSLAWRNVRLAHND
jgi:hypothetical protein